MDKQYDVVIVGGGAAGLAGAVALARSRRSVLVIDAGAPRNARADGVHNFLTREGTPPADLLALGRAEVTGYGGEVTSGQATRVHRDTDGKGFDVLLADGRGVHARRLMVTTGATDELPAIPGLAERWGHDVLHCPFCHGWEARDRAIGILGTGPMALHATLLWRQISPDVTLFLHTAPPLTPEQAEQLAALQVPVVEGEVKELVITDDQLTGVRMRNGDVIP
ncbi:MAG: NAD(P)/FAD-dependent oxidoreductase, partial [Chloroflexota bacterium]|nr:NAD(P)/FAD-dependent oxidoreductase [Chloroflexota bacterium]